MDNLQPLLLSFDGRINRARFWTGVVVVIAVVVVAMVIAAVIGFILGDNIITTPWSRFWPASFAWRRYGRRSRWV
jgi:uncharacterized membrane protein YhaH (DUF805 family)